MVAMDGTRELEVAIPGRAQRHASCRRADRAERGRERKRGGQGQKQGAGADVTLPNMPLPSLCALPHIMTLTAAAEILLSTSMESSSGSTVARRAGAASDNAMLAGKMPESGRGAGER
jgi:hypothetical protein